MKNLVRAAVYNPRENGGEVRVLMTVSEPARWRIDITVWLQGEASPYRRPIYVRDRLLLSDVREVAFAAIAEITPEGGVVENAELVFNVQVPGRGARR